jgi:hypothetical protein
MSDDDRTRRKREEVDNNLKFFLEELPKIPQIQRGKFAILRNREIIGFYDTAIDAFRAASTAFSDGIFSIQQVTDTAIDLGYYSHAVPLATTQ